MRLLRLKKSLTLTEALRKTGIDILLFQGKKIKVVNIIDKGFRSHTIKKAMHIMYRPEKPRIIKEGYKDNVVNIFTLPKYIMTNGAELTPFLST